MMKVIRSLVGPDYNENFFGVGALGRIGAE